MKRRNLVRAWLGISLTALTVSAIAQAPPARAAVVSLDIKSQPITAALNDFGRQTGLQVLFYSDVADGVKEVPALTGAFTPDEALTQLLSKTGLMYSYIDERTVAIHRAISNVSEGETRREPGRPMMRLAADVQMLPESNGEQVQETVHQAVDRQDSSEARASRSARMEEVIVTARKRAENIQDVPISVTVVTSDEIERRGLVDAEDYLRGVPGTNQVEGAYGQTIVIRGIETSPHLQNFFSGPTTATYFGEIPTTNTAGLGAATNVDLKLVDIERVEVLRGPQGTAFGSSSMGGAVRTIPAAPNLDAFEAKLAAGYSSTDGAGGDNHNIYAVANIPLATDIFAIRAVAYQYEDSGLYRNSAGSNAAFRASVVTPYGAEAFAVNRDEVGSYSARGGRIAALYQPIERLQFTLSYVMQETETDGMPLATVGTYEQALLQVAPEHVVRGEKGGVSDTDIDIANAIVEYDFGWADLLATYSHIESGSRQSYPYGAVDLAWPVSSDAISDHREHVSEIRLVTKLQGPWNFVAGFYAEELEDDAIFDNLWHADATTNFLDVSTELGMRVDNRELEQKAAFGELSWEFLRGLTLTGGIRAYEYDRTFVVDAAGFFYGGATGTHLDEETEASGENFRLNLSYKLDDALLYAGWSEGFRLGQPQIGLSPNLCDLDADGIVDGTSITLESTRRVNSDEVDSYELGAKFALFDRRITIAADVFRMEWSEVPVQVRPGSGTCIAGYVANAGEAQSDGVEFQANFQITDAFRLDLGGSWIDAKLTKAVPALNAPKGNRLPGSPKVNANIGAQYDFDLGRHRAFVRTDAIYVGDFYGDLLESPTLKSGDYVKLDSSVHIEIGRLNAALFVDNLTNEDAFTFRGIRRVVGPYYGYRLRPRTIGLRLGFAF